jgi:glycerate 2-kinase
MKIVIAPDKFKGCLSAANVAESIALGVRKFDPAIQVDLCPLADGGEGTVAAMVAATGSRIITRRVTGPLPEMKIDAALGMLDGGKTAVIEMSAASGIALLKPADRNPLNTTTFGTGELIAAAVRERACKIILGIGGSATIDAGLGCAQACGFTILMRDGEPTSMTEPLCGRDIGNVIIVKHGRGEVTDGIQIIVACDVTNPLYGEQGAARIYGPQKGATEEIVAKLDNDLRKLAQRTGKEPEALQPGAGAAGGLGFGMLAFFGASLRSGFELIADATKLRDRLADADLCFTGEGRIDGQSASGKTVGGIARICREMRVPCIALVGAIGEGAEKVLQQGLSEFIAISNQPLSVDHAGDQLAQTAANYLRRRNHQP